MRKGRIIAVLLLLLAWWWWRPSTADAQRELFNRVWISHIPADEQDTIDVLVLLADQEQGVFQTTSAYRGHHDVFAYAATGEGELRLRLLQDGRESRVRYVVRQDCRPGFDWCLTVDGAPRGPRDYFSRHGWETDQPDSLVTEIARVRAALH